MEKAKIYLYINNKFSSLKNIKITNFQNEENLFSNGIFETFRTYQGKIFRQDDHLKRFFASAKALNLQVPLTFQKLKNALKKIINSCKFSEIRIRLSLSNYQNPVIIIICTPLSIFLQEIKITTSSLRRKEIETENPRIKTLSCLNNILALKDALNTNEVIMLNKNGFLAEGTYSNIFLVLENILLTPHSCVGILKGITRDVICEIANELNIECKETFLTRYDLYNADECFITCTTQGIIPVIEVDKRIIGNGKIGKITQKIMQKFIDKTLIEK
ncbi:MAG: aminotransferase class IV [bacterium]